MALYCPNFPERFCLERMRRSPHTSAHVLEVLRGQQINLVYITEGTTTIYQPLTGNALERVQRVHKPADLWDITF